MEKLGVMEAQEAFAKTNPIPQPQDIEMEGAKKMWYETQFIRNYFLDNQTVGLATHLSILFPFRQAT